MLLLTKDLINRLPPIQSGAKNALLKLFLPWSNWTWYASEASAVLPDGSEVPLTDPAATDRVDVLFFGVVEGFETEYGYFVLSELSELRGPGGLRIERDRYWTPLPLAECAKLSA